MNKLTTKKLLIISIGLMLSTVLLSVILVSLDDAPYKNLDGTEIQPHSPELIRTVILGQVVSVPLFSFLIGLVVAIFIDKHLPYSQRIGRSFLLTLSII